MLNYENTIYFAETWGLVLLVGLFVLGVGYALWPSNKNKFQSASMLPLEDDAALEDEKGDIK